MTEQPLERPLRVCVLTSVHPPMDTRIYHREAKAARDGGADVLLLAPGAPAGTHDGIRFGRLPVLGGRRWSRPLRWPVLAWKAYRARADIYHLHDPELLPWGLLLKWVTGASVVYDSHEYLREGISTKYWIPRRLRQPLSVAADRVEKWIAGRLDAVVAVTEEMAERFARVQPRVITVRNLPPVSEVPEPPERKPIVMYAGLLNADRGLSILYETARQVHERHPEAEFHIYGPVEWHGIDAATRDLDEDDWTAMGVRFRGSVPFDEVGPAIARGMVGWLPRSPDEPNNLLAWPNKLVEYMAAGLAIVASDLPLQARVVSESESGIVVDALSPGGHAAAICHLLEDAETRRRLGANGKAAARTRYTWETEALKLRTLYADLGAAKPLIR